MNAVSRSSLMALILGAGITAAAEAQGNQYTQQITSQLTRAAQHYANQGYSADRAPVIGNLNNQSDESHQVNLTGGRRYAIIGVCDNDCRDVDLQVFSGDGTKIGEDLETDDQPLVNFTAQYSGQYRVKVLMANCNTNPCYYGVQVLVRN